MYTLQEFKADFPDDKACLDWLIRERYPNGCPHCGSKLYYMTSRKSYACAKHHHVSPTAGTIFHKSHQPFHNWFHAIYLVSQYGNTITAKQLERQYNITYKTAWRMLDLIRSLDNPDRKTEITKNVGIYPTTGGKYRSRTKVGSKTINLGTYDTHQEAQEAYLNAKKILKTKPRYKDTKTPSHT